jgi:hypothetical protein
MREQIAESISRSKDICVDTKKLSDSAKKLTAKCEESIKSNELSFKHLKA